MINKKLHLLNAAAKERAALIEDWHTGEYNYTELGKKYGIHSTTAKEWIAYYEKEGVAGLKRKRKPRPKHKIDVKELENFRHAAADAGQDRSAWRASILIELEEKNIQLKQVAAREEVSSQAILKWRRAWIAGEWTIEPKATKEVYLNNALVATGKTKIPQLAELSKKELLTYKNIGKKTVKAVQEELKFLGLKLNTKK